MKKGRIKLVTLFSEAVMVIVGFIFLYPVIFMVLTSIRTRFDFSSSPVGFPRTFTLSNIVEAAGKMHFLNVFKNSIIVTGVSLVIILLIGSMASYPISRRSFKGANHMYMFFTAGMLVPIQICMVPLYKMMLNLGLMNHLLSCILVYCGAWMTSTIFIYTGFIKTIPRELDEASYIDGASKLCTFFRVVFPLLKPVNATLAIITSIGIWNDFLLPLLYLQKIDVKTIQLGLYAFSGIYGTDWTGMFSAMILTTGPMIILYMFSSKHIIKGIASGALKS
jgi:raffinose/stachyose/melibiose transport system permease protein